MIRGHRATLAVYSEALTVAEITAALECEPTEGHDKGELTRAGRAGRGLPPHRLHYQRTHWSLDDTDPGTSEEDQTEFAAVRRVVDKVLPRASAFADLRQDGETIMWWSGFSDSGQGGFVLPAELMRDLALLGCDLYGTAFLQDDRPDEDETD